VAAQLKTFVHERPLPGDPEQRGAVRPPHDLGDRARPPVHDGMVVPDGVQNQRVLDAIARAAASGRRERVEGPRSA